MQEFSKDNLAWLVALQLSKGKPPMHWQIISGYRVLCRQIAHRRRLKLPIIKHMAEYREAKKILFPEGCKNEN